MKFSTRHKKQLADLITPVSACLKLRGNFSELILLESIDYNSAANSKSFIRLEPLKTFSLEENELKITTHCTLSEAKGHNTNNSEHRTFYGGAIGYISLNGEVLNKAIIFRSFLSHKNKLHFKAGAAIVIDSNPESELQEINNKLAALVSAIKLAETV